VRVENSGAIYAQVPDGDVGTLEAAMREVTMAMHAQKPSRLPHAPAFLGVLAFDSAIHKYALIDRWGRADDMPGWAESTDFRATAHLEALSAKVGRVVAFYE